MRRLVMVVVAGLFVLTACPDRSTGPPSFGTVRLDNVPDGVGQLRVDKASKTVSLQIDAFGFAPSTTHPVQIQAGTCLDPAGPATVSFTDLEADSAGRAKATVTSTAPVPGGIPAKSRVQVGATTPAARNPLMCTDLPADPGAAFRLYPFPSEKPFGNAEVIYRDGRLTLELSLQAMPRNHRHRLEIGEGSCRAQKGLRHLLDPVATDRNGAAKTARTKSTPEPQETGWFLVVRTGTGDKDRPILCGDFGSLRAGSSTSTTTGTTAQ